MKAPTLSLSKLLLIGLMIYAGNLFSQLLLAPSSTVFCHQAYSSVHLTLRSGSAPYSIAVQAANCPASYTAQSQGAALTLTFSCAGVYTVSVTDASQTALGSATHTVSVANTLPVNIYTSTKHDTLCYGNSLRLYALLGSGEAASLPVSWSTGETASSILISPGHTGVYSYTAHYGPQADRNCSATGSKTISVASCFHSISPYGLHNADVSVFPNPASEKIYFSSWSEVNTVKIYSGTGQLTASLVKPPLDNGIDIRNLASGLYFLQIENDPKQYKFQVVKQ